MSSRPGRLIKILKESHAKLAIKQFLMQNTSRSVFYATVSLNFLDTTIFSIHYSPDKQYLRKTQIKKVSSVVQFLQIHLHPHLRSVSCHFFPGIHIITRDWLNLQSSRMVHPVFLVPISLRQIHSKSSTFRNRVSTLGIHCWIF